MTKFVVTTHPRARHKRLAVMEYKQVEPIKDMSTLNRVTQAWIRTKSPLGYTSYTSIYSQTHFPYSKIFGVLKWLHLYDPHAVTFNVDRRGNNVYFKLNFTKKT